MGPVWAALHAWCTALETATFAYNRAANGWSTDDDDDDDDDDG